MILLQFSSSRVVRRSTSNYWNGLSSHTSFHLVYSLLFVHLCRLSSWLQKEKKRKEKKRKIFDLLQSPLDQIRKVKCPSFDSRNFYSKNGSKYVDYSLVTPELDEIGFGSLKRGNDVKEFFFSLFTDFCQGFSSEISRDKLFSTIIYFCVCKGLRRQLTYTRV